MVQGLDQDVAASQASGQRLCIMRSEVREEKVRVRGERPGAQATQRPGEVRGPRPQGRHPGRDLLLVPERRHGRGLARSRQRVGVVMDVEVIGQRRREDRVTHPEAGQAVSFG